MEKQIRGFLLYFFSLVHARERLILPYLAPFCQVGDSTSSTFSARTRKHSSIGQK